MKSVHLALLPCLLAGSVFAAPAAPVTAPQAPPSEADWRTPDPQDVLVIDTNKGRVIVEMNAALAPLAVARVRELTRTGVYNGRAFFRVIDNFMDQTGDPQDNGTGSSTLPNLAPEFTFRRSSDMSFTTLTKNGGLETGFIGSVPVISQPMDLGALTADNKVSAYATFCSGVAGMARADAPDSGNSQFYLMRGSNSSLDRKYTVWGRVIAGEDVVRAVKTGEPPAPPADQMTKVRVLADMPVGERPQVRVIDTKSPWFTAMVERVKADKAADPSICDIDLPSQIK
jgi:peptidylprolyl isomerase